MRLDQKETVKRLVIYFFYDADGIVDRYVPYMLEDLKKNCSEIFVICNGELTPEGRDVFNKITQNVMVRENVGFDVWAYKTALEHYGWEKLAEYDEVILMNHTIMGPVYPFAEVFAEMDGRDVDFWGLTAFHKVPFDPFGTISYGYIPRHLQSSFIAVRSSMLTSIEFKDYWETRPPITSYSDAVGKHEAIFTKTFEDKGFVSSCYVDTTDMESYTNHPIMKAPLELVKHCRCPIFKRRSFFHSYIDLLEESNGSQGRELLEYLKEHTSYDVDMIWENILRTSHMADVKANLHLDYILPKKYCVNQSQGMKTALVIHCYFEDLIEACYEFALSMPDDADIYVTTNTQEKAEKIRQVFAEGPWKNQKVIQIENRGRDVSALLVAAAPYLDGYDAVCFVHDKKVTQLDYGIVGHYFMDRCFENCLGSKAYVQNILRLFSDNPRLGLLCPPPPNFGYYYSTSGCEWGPNYDCTEKLAQELKLRCPMSPEKEPVAPLGTMFWFRPKALAPLLSHGWKYEDFPKEPNATDGTLLHAVERIYPFVAQSEGYYAAWVMSDGQAELEWNNLSYMQRGTNVQLFSIVGPHSYWGLIKTLTDGDFNKKGRSRFALKRKLKSMLPKPLWNFMKKLYHAFGGKKWVG